MDKAATVIRTHRELIRNYRELSPSKYSFAEHIARLELCCGDRVFGLTCTRRPDHRGRHEAGIGRLKRTGPMRITAVWDQT